MTDIDIVELTNHDPTWQAGLPVDGADRCWLGESADGRQWLMRWATKRDCWCITGFALDWGTGSLEYPEVRAILEEHRDFIVRHLALPATRQEEAA